MARFFGRYEHSLDAKGRIILPARFRGNFDTQVFVTQYHDRCLALWTPDRFEQRLAETEATMERSSADRNLARVWLRGVAEVELDRQGRVALPGNLRDFARLDGQVLIHGALNHIELWNPEEYDTRIAPFEAGLTDPEPADPVAAGA